jgi:hypothetical protein
MPCAMLISFYLVWSPKHSLVRAVDHGAPIRSVSSLLQIAGEWMSMEHWWKTTKGKLRYSEKTPAQCHFVHHKSHMHWPGIKTGPPQLQTADYLPVIPTDNFWPLSAVLLCVVAPSVCDAVCSNSRECACSCRVANKSYCKFVNMTHKIQRGRTV